MNSALTVSYSKQESTIQLWLEVISSIIYVILHL